MALFYITVSNLGTHYTLTPEAVPYSPNIQVIYGCPPSIVIARAAKRLMLEDDILGCKRVQHRP